MAAYNKYATFILYRFSQNDYGYNQIEQKKDSAFNANPAYISPVLRFLHEHLFHVFPERFLQKTMPYKILLASYIGGKDTRSAVNFASTYATLTIGWADSTFLQQTTDAQKRKLRSNLIRFYMERAFRAGSIESPQDFKALAPPSYVAVSTQALRNQWGVIEPSGRLLTSGSDFLGYVEAICTRSRADIEEAYFNPAVDTKGYYKLKYRAVITYFDTKFGIDLQAIGDAF